MIGLFLNIHLYLDDARSTVFPNIQVRYGNGHRFELNPGSIVGSVIEKRINSTT
jgi:hypothetical protein